MEVSLIAMNDDARTQFAELFERHRKIVFKVAHTYAWQLEDRADLVQEIAAQLWRAFPGYQPERSFSTWMYRIALNVGISWLRSHGGRNALTDSLEAAHDDLVGANDVSAEAEQNLRALHDCIAQQEPLNRALLMLYLDERSHREIAEILGISEANVATKINRLKQRVRDQLAPRALA